MLIIIRKILFIIMRYIVPERVNFKLTDSSVNKCFPFEKYYSLDIRDMIFVLGFESYLLLRNMSLKLVVSVGRSVYDT